MSICICMLLLTLVWVLIVLLSNHAWNSTFTLLAVCINAGISFWFAIQAVSGSNYQEIISGGAVFGIIPIRMDALSGWFIILINITMLSGILYGRRYMLIYENKSSVVSLHFGCYILNHLAMIGILCIQNSLAF